MSRSRNTALVALVSALASCWSTAPRPTPGPAASFFGVHFGTSAVDGSPQLPKHPWPMCDGRGACLAAGALRAWDSHTAWIYLQTSDTGSDSDFYWAPLDASVSRAQQANLPLLLTMGSTPPFISSNPAATGCHWGDGSCAPPSDLDSADDCTAMPYGVPAGATGNCHWKRFIYKLVEHLKRADGTLAIRWFEPGNEINLLEFWNDSGFACGVPDASHGAKACADYAKMARDAYTFIKREDPSVVVTTPSITKGGGPAAGAQYCSDPSNPCSNFADAIAFHFYCPAGQCIPEHDGILAGWKNLRDRYLPGGQLLDTEGGWAQNANVDPATANCPAVAISDISVSGTTATVTTSAPHGYLTGQLRRIWDNSNPTLITPFEGSIAITVTDATHFTFATAANSGGTGGIVDNVTCTDSPFEQAAYLSRWFLRQWDQGVQTVWWYSWGDGQWGELFDSNSNALRQGAVAFNTIRIWLEGAVQSGPCGSNGSTWTCNLRRDAPAGYLAQVIWDISGTATDFPTTYAPAAPYIGKTWYRLDMSSGTTGATIGIGHQPILLTNQ